VARRLAWYVLAIAAVPILTVFLYQGSVWQGDIHRLAGKPPPTQYEYLGVLPLALVLVAVLYGAAIALRVLARAVTGVLSRRAPERVARLVAGTLVVMLVGGLLDRVVYGGLLRLADSAAAALDQTSDGGVVPPAGQHRSGGTGSQVSWASLGLQGRSFVAGGPGLEDLRRFSGDPPVAPIRAYAGLASAPNVREQAALVVRELRRTGAFSRRVLCVIVTTGTGWVDPIAADALEYLYNGDTALAGMQYS
jgi:uncharacterized membrane protein